MEKMDVSPFWAFSEDWETQLVEFIETTTGQWGTEVIFLTPNGERRIFISKIVNLRDLQKVLGKDGEKWVGKRFEMRARGDKFELEYKPEL